MDQIGKKLLEDYDDQQITLELELDAYKRERHWQDVEEEDNQDTTTEPIQLELTEEESRNTIRISQENQGLESEVEVERSHHKERQQSLTAVIDQEEKEPIPVGYPK